MRFDPSVGRERERVEVVRAQGLFDIGHYHARLCKKAEGYGRAFWDRAKPIDCLRSLLITENLNRARHDETSELYGFPNPAQIGDDGARVEQP
jgi:hypothetical protein